MQKLTNSPLMYPLNFYLAIGLFVTIAGCSKPDTGSNDDNGKPSAHDPPSNGALNKQVDAGIRADSLCAKMTLAKLKEITGVEFQHIKPVPSPAGSPGCGYRIGKGEGTQKWEYQIVTTRSAMHGSLKMKGLKRAAHKIVPGFGDDAVWTPMPGHFGVRRGDSYVGVTVRRSMGDAAARLEIAKKIITLLMKRNAI